MNNNCALCNKPCILVDGKCRIAKVRVALNLSFKDAFECITSISNDNQVWLAVNQNHTNYFRWMNEGEPMPLDFQI